jgi:glycerol-3-phosphate acyltransferase PlsY
VQEAAAASVAPTGQVVDCVKELALVPVKLTVEKLTAAVPVFLTVIKPLVALVAPTTVAGNAYVVGDTVTVAVVVVGHAWTRLYAFTEPKPVARS